MRISASATPMPSTEEVERLLREVTGKLDVADRKRAREAKDLELKLDQVQRNVTKLQKDNTAMKKVLEARNEGGVEEEEDDDDEPPPMKRSKKNGEQLVPLVKCAAAASPRPTPLRSSPPTRPRPLPPPGAGPPTPPSSRASSSRPTRAIRCRPS